MIVIRGTYLASIEDVNVVRGDHVSWIGEHIASGAVIAAGRTTPPDGSVLLFSGSDSGAALLLLGDDPYVTAGVAEYRVEAVFTPVVHAHGFEQFAS